MGGLKHIAMILVSALALIALMVLLMVTTGCSVKYTCTFGDKVWSKSHQNCYWKGGFHEKDRLQ